MTGEQPGSLHDVLRTRRMYLWELANAAGIPVNRLYRISRGSPIEHGEAHTIARVLGQPPDQLFAGMTVLPPGVKARGKPGRKRVSA